jgi:hypothetical protein
LFKLLLTGGVRRVQSSTCPSLATPFDPARFVQAIEDITNGDSDLKCLTDAMVYASAGDATDSVLPFNPDVPLRPGVYSSTAAVSLTGTLSLDSRGIADAVWIFRLGGALTIAADTQMVFVDSSPDSNNNIGSAANVYWNIVGAATLGAGTTTFTGTLMASGAITVGAGVATYSLLSSGGAINLAAGATANGEKHIRSQQLYLCLLLAATNPILLLNSTPS